MDRLHSQPLEPLQGKHLQAVHVVAFLHHLRWFQAQRYQSHPLPHKFPSCFVETGTDHTFDQAMHRSELDSLPQLSQHSAHGQIHL